MGLLEDLGVATAKQLLDRLGPRAALRLLEPIVASGLPSPSRASAILVAMECAIDLRDDLALEHMATAWRAENEVAREDAIAPLCARLLERSRPGLAWMLANADVERRDRPRARLVRAICTEARGEHEGSIAEYSAAADAADAAGDARVARAARVEELRALVGPSHQRARALSVSKRIDIEKAPRRARLYEAIAKLGELGRYVRAAGLDTLVELAAGNDSTLAKAAIRSACAHADETGSALTTIEADRIASALSHWPANVEREQAAAVLTALAEGLEGDAASRSTSLLRAAGLDAKAKTSIERARAVLSGDAPGPRPDSGDQSSTATWLALSAVAAIRQGRDEEARERLREARALAPRIPSSPSWTAAWLALERPALRSEGIALIGAMLSTNATPPPRGFTHLAEQLEAAGALDEAMQATQRAHERREPGARERLVDACTRRGWKAAQAGKRDEAIELLRKARTIAGR